MSNLLVSYVIKQVSNVESINGPLRILIFMHFYYNSFIFKWYHKFRMVIINSFWKGMIWATLVKHSSILNKAKDTALKRQMYKFHSSNFRTNYNSHWISTNCFIISQDFQSLSIFIFILPNLTITYDIKISSFTAVE